MSVAVVVVQLRAAAAPYCAACPTFLLKWSTCRQARRTLTRTASTGLLVDVLREFSFGSATTGTLVQNLSFYRAIGSSYSSPSGHHLLLGSFFQKTETSICCALHRQYLIKKNSCYQAHKKFRSHVCRHIDNMVSCTSTFLVLLAVFLCLVKNTHANGSFIGGKPAFHRSMMAPVYSIEEESALFGMRYHQEASAGGGMRNCNSAEDDNESARFALQYNEELEELGRSQSAYLRRNTQSLMPSIIVPV